MAGPLQRLAAALPGRHLRLLGVIALISMVTATVEFATLVTRENGLVDRLNDSSWWMATVFRAEVQALHIGLATFDGSPARMQEVRTRYDIVYGRLRTIADSDLEPPPGPAFLRAFGDVRARVLALEPRILALRPADPGQVSALRADMRALETEVGHLTAVAGQEDAAHRGALHAAVVRANIAFGLTAALLIASLLLTLRAVIRQAAVLDSARRRSEALSADLTAALARAEAGARAKSAFLATMSHEIRTPMNGVLGAASLLAHTRLSDTQQRWVAIVRECGEALLAQLDDVLDFSALEADAVTLQPERVDVRALAEAAARAVDGTASQKALDLVIVVDPDVPDAVVTDRRRLAQVLLNLLNNAVKFTAAGGVSVRVSLRRGGGRAWLRAAVIDTGPGVPRADRRRIFDEFARLERETERGARGTGLGLAISRRVVAALGGTLNVADAPGGGSLFWLRIPVEIPPDAHAPGLPPVIGTAAVLGAAPPLRRMLERLLRAEGYLAAAPAAPPGVPLGENEVSLLLLHGAFAGDVRPAASRQLRFGPGTALDGVLTADILHAALAEPGAPRPDAAPHAAPLRLLLADDDPINREIAASLLRHLGHVVATASDGAEALAIARARVFDCILLDLQMPGLDGIELARALRALPGPQGRTRLVAVTADVDAGARAAVMAAGFSAILTKPVTLERLAGVLPAAGVGAPSLGAIDAETRHMLATRLPAPRFAALVRTFWEELMRVLERPDGLPGPHGDRRLHSLAGSSASLGYISVAAAARAGRAALATAAPMAAPMAAPLRDLLDALAGALAADAALLPEDLVARAATVMAAARAGLATDARVGAEAVP